MARKDALIRLHSRLVKRRDALRKALSGDLESLSDYANDEISTQLAELESRELEQIENALRRIEEGAYGSCEHCGGKIAEARLNALPYTNTCIECQREAERFGSMGARGYAPAQRWDKLDDKRSDDSERDTPINLSDFEMDLSETGR